MNKKVQIPEKNKNKIIYVIINNVQKLKLYLAIGFVTNKGSTVGRFKQVPL